MYSKNIKSTCEKRGRSTGNLRYSYKRHLREKFIELLLLLAAFFSVLITFSIVFMLIKESITFFQHVSIWEFLTDRQWTPLFDDAHYGILPVNA